LDAQQPSNPPPADVVFSVTTLRVQVDAVVTDSKGRYATDLTADDFAIYDDGKPQKITNFSYISVTPQSSTGYKAEKRPVPKIDGRKRKVSSRWGAGALLSPANCQSI